MHRLTRLLVVGTLILVPACGDGNGPAADPITGSWSGRFDNGISITASLTLTGSTIGGTFDTGDSNGNVTGTYSSTTFSIQLTAATGTQRTLSNSQLVNSNTRITAHWDDGSGLNGELCLAKAGSTACP